MRTTGPLWIGTKAGLGRLDGIDWAIYTASP